MHSSLNTDLLFKIKVDILIDLTLISEIKYQLLMLKILSIPSSK